MKMAEANKNRATGSSGGGRGKSTYKKTKSSPSGGAGRGKPAKNTAEKRRDGEESFISQMAPFLAGAVAVMLGVCLYLPDSGVVGGFLKTVFFGLFSMAAYLTPVLALIIAVMWKRDCAYGMVKWKILNGLALVVLVAMLVHCLAAPAEMVKSLGAEHFANGRNLSGGGMIGGFLGALMVICFSKVGALVVIFTLLAVLLMLMFGITPKGLYIFIAYKIKMAKDRRETTRARMEEYRADNMKRMTTPRSPAQPREEAPPAPRQMTLDEAPAPKRFKAKKKFNTDVPVDEPDEPAEADMTGAGTDIDTDIFDDALRAAEMLPSDGGKAEDAIADEPAPAAAPPVDEPVLADIFSEAYDGDLLDRLAAEYMSSEERSAEIEVKNGVLTVPDEVQDAAEKAESEERAEVEPPAPEYVFPPANLLSHDEGKRDTNIRDELHANATRLVETLASFNVKTRIVGVSRGPTITRYELLPEPGTRVRSISNLVDDIALNLATTGVRIEAPIPGKNAVGIEVPNKNSAVVHLRTLLETSDFTQAKSRINAALGEDVAGKAQFVDIARMPHLLIAGATGMGKSVCINSIIVSLLYKAKPDEVKLILIDPKKVELNIYNGLPHLLVPVVSDPKKAAGSLGWAVNEMERRFGLIEAVGVRDIHAYNSITASDPDYEFMPQIVIIIDELADLMMTAPDDVEQSICRLAQKARAAGMHLIIGTQRPSVDVITGLIKSNIPSRIAFTVASQVDSRTIIDRSGAENLIGRGDMLYNPVGAAKPIRVQGAFVSESEVESVVSFIRENNTSKAGYSDEVINQIEQEAARCGTGKKGSSSAAAGGADAVGDDDPMLRQALELAVESGKISTSLIQRRLSLGYGRAAKLIDRMEQLGYVSAPDGQKPRAVLISKQEFMEMVVRGDDE